MFDSKKSFIINALPLENNVQVTLVHVEKWEMHWNGLAALIHNHMGTQVTLTYFTIVKYDFIIIQLCGNVWKLNLWEIIISMKICSMNLLSWKTISNVYLINMLQIMKKNTYLVFENLNNEVVYDR